MSKNCLKSCLNRLIFFADSLRRDAEDIPAEEIANGVKGILSHQISLLKEDLVREASKLFGFARSGANVENAMKEGNC